MALVVRNLQDKLQELSKNINDYAIRQEIDRLVQQAQAIASCATHAFSISGGDVLRQKKTLSEIRCPSRVDIENLSQTLLAFKEDVNNCFEKALAMKTSINDFIEISRGKEKCKEREIEEVFNEIKILDKQIQLADTQIRMYEDEARKEEREAQKLDIRASDLRRESEQHRENGKVWGLASVGVGLLFAPFTGGASLIPALASAGIGMKVNFDNANECNRTAAKLRVRAEDQRAEAQRQRTIMGVLEFEKTAKSSQIKSRKTMIEDLSKTCDGLIELERHLKYSVSGFERAVYIVQDFLDALHMTMLQGDSFGLLKEVFIECPEEFYDEAHEGLKDLKVKWTELEQLFLVRPFDEKKSRYCRYLIGGVCVCVCVCAYFCVP